MLSFMHNFDSSHKISKIHESFWFKVRKDFDVEEEGILSQILHLHHDKRRKYFNISVSFPFILTPNMESKRLVYFLLISSFRAFQ